MCWRLYNAGSIQSCLLCGCNHQNQLGRRNQRCFSEPSPPPPVSIGPKTLHLCHSCVVNQAPSYLQPFRTAILAICAAVLGLIIAQRPAEPTCVLPRRQLHQICALGTAEPVEAQPSRKWVVDFSLFLLHSKSILPV